MSDIEDFVVDLTKQRNTATVRNPYLEPDAAENLRLYLLAMGKMKGRRILLVGEAPGYKGCGITGIPFSSGRVFDRFDHPLLKEIRGQIKFGRIESENTATIVWEYLCEKNTTPLFWNSFPFHPHAKGNRKSNRAPTAAEVERGIGYLQKLYAMFRPETVGGIGRKGVECAVKAFPRRKIVAIRHPSFGGKAKFIAGMDKIL